MGARPGVGWRCPRSGPHPAEASGAPARPSPHPRGPKEGHSSFITGPRGWCPRVAPSVCVSVFTPTCYFSTSLCSYPNPRLWPPVLVACFFVGSGCRLTSVQMLVASSQPGGPRRLGWGAGGRLRRAAAVPRPDASGWVSCCLSARREGSYCPRGREGARSV